MTELEKRKATLQVLKEEALKHGLQITSQDEKNIVANGITSLEQLNGINLYYKMIKGQNVNYSYVPTTRDERNVPVPGRRRK